MLAMAGLRKRVSRVEYLILSLTLRSYVLVQIRLRHLYDPRHHLR
jgi:hypothetical protein